ncbi:amino acid adenylation domain-containing protein [Streptomyces sp. NPDC051217]|uniref:amino acid adenylation domain-containing protein n=1 Tax=Streptomyces sp. NPDC051217 TaxID=3365644 RepID=UPI0037946723
MELPASLEEAPHESVLAVALAALVHRYTALDRVSIDRLDGPYRISVGMTDDSSTVDLIESVDTSPLPDRAHGAFALSLAGDSGGAGTETPYELVLYADMASSGMTLSFDAVRFEDASVDRITGHFKVLLDQMSEAPDAPVSRLTILTAAEADTMLRAWNETETRLTDDICLHQAFEAQAAKNPDALAAVSGEDSWSFDKVNRRANELAHRLIGLGVGPDIRVGIHLEKAAGLLIAVLAVLKAGGAYVPLDPRYPRDRLARMLLGTNCQVLISGRALEQTPPAQVPHHLVVDEVWSRPDPPSENPVTEVRPDSLCYVIHTSGSTGSPKPIALCHRGVLNNIADLNARYGVGPGDSVLALSSPSFDMSVYEFLGLTIAGGTVVIPDQESGYHPDSWLDLVVRHDVTVWNSAPPLMELFLDFVEITGDARPLPLKLSLTGGDWVPATMPARFRKVAPGLRFVALGGATEASIHSTAFESEESMEWSGGHLPYGWPLANQRTFVLDDRMMPVPIDVAGELYLGGVGLARGYLDRPRETGERFVQWSYGEHPAQRLYRTGDIARLSPDGLIEILGRKDFQVKINGMRVELGEIESTIAAHPGVRRAVVVSRVAPNGHTSLAAYVTAERAGTPDYASIFDSLHARLPKHMIPSSIEIVDSLPLNGNGKVDRLALSSPTEEGIPAPREAAEPGGPGGPANDGKWYRLVIDAWLDVLGVDHLEGHDNFFEHGGDSMKAIRGMVRIDRRLRLSDIYEHPTASALVGHLTAVYGECPSSSS